MLHGSPLSADVERDFDISFPCAGAALWQSRPGEEVEIIHTSAGAPNEPPAPLPQPPHPSSYMEVGIYD
jgi:hypothetical protein